jgi:hypothetical protein
MPNSVEKVDIKIDLADAGIPNYLCLRKEKKMIVTIESWDAQIIEFVFYNFLGFIYRGGTDLIKNFYINKEQDTFFIERLKEKHGIVPNDHPYKFYQLLDLDDKPYFEVISPYYEVSIKPKVNSVNNS